MVLFSVPLESGVRTLKSYLTEPTLNSDFHRQEKPDLQEPPESAPAGIGVDTLLRRELPAGNIFLISELWHALQVIADISEDERTLSKSFPHLLQENR